MPPGIIGRVRGGQFGGLVSTFGTGMTASVIGDPLPLGKLKLERGVAILAFKRPVTRVHKTSR